ncbi:MAG: esterase-like activity of phytase family protein [bacterium]|nr:esterase-like activity of phytase family protein [bacterium]
MNNLKKIFIKFSVIILLLLSTACNQSDSPEIKRFIIEKIPRLIGVGSGLTRYEKTRAKRDSSYFYTVSDGGNQPAIVEITIKKSIASVINTFEIVSDQKLDLEDIAIGPNGNFWLANEIGPSLIEFNPSSSKIIEILSPGLGLPDILKNIQPGRGFESLAIDGNTLIAALQSVLNIKGESKSKAQFIRFLVFDLKSKKSKMLAYPIEISSDGTRKDYQLTGMTAISKSKVLIIEQELGVLQKGVLREETLSAAKIFLCDLSNATDLTDLSLNNQELEFEEDRGALFGSLLSKKGAVITPIEKKLILNLSDIGWTLPNPEGIAILDDYKTIVLSNDNNSSEAAFWQIELNTPLKINWWKRVLWSIGIIIMFLTVIWSFSFKEKPISFKVKTSPDDLELEIETENKDNHSKLQKSLPKIKDF